MKCPTCPAVSLVMTDRSGIEIDYCPECRGVWLDRGELDKIIERTTLSLPAPRPASPIGTYPADAVAVPGQPARRDRDDDDDDFDDDDRRRFPPQFASDGGPTRKRRKKSLLGELFDF